MCDDCFDKWVLIHLTIPDVEEMISYSYLWRKTERAQLRIPSSIQREYLQNIDVYLRECYGENYHELESYYNHNAEEEGDVVFYYQDFAMKTTTESSSGTDFTRATVYHCWVHEPLRALKRFVPEKFEHLFLKSSKRVMVCEQRRKRRWGQQDDDEDYDQYLYDETIVKTPTDIYRKTHSFKFKYVLEEFVCAPPGYLPFTSLAEKGGKRYRETNKDFYIHEKIQQQTTDKN